MDYDPANYCDECCPGRASWLGSDQPCTGTGHVPKARCVTCKRMDMARQEREERQTFTIIEQRRNDPEFMARLQRHVTENQAALNRLADH